MTITYRGVAYDTGSTFLTGQGALSRNVWDADLMAAELDLIVELNANSVNLYGSDLGRLSDAATAAVERGLRVWLDPRLPDRSQDEVIDHIAEVARLAESLRKQGATIDLAVGGQHTVLTPGILPGEPYLERIATIFFDGDTRFGVREGKTTDQGLTLNVQSLLNEAAPRLNEFLGRAVGVARGIFDGRIGVSGAPWEPIDWTPFDLIGVTYVLMPSYLTREQHLAELAKFTRWGKPVLISAFGTASYQGAEEKGFFNWDIVDRGGPTLTIVDGHERDESVQASYYTKMLGIYEEAGIYGAAPVDLVHPTHPHSEDPRLDLDMASMCIVKSIRDDFDDPNSPYRREKKQSFHAIADYYARSGASAAA